MKMFDFLMDMEISDISQITVETENYSILSLIGLSKCKLIYGDHFVYILPSFLLPSPSERCANYSSSKILYDSNRYDKMTRLRKTRGVS